jgi:hypothetical protein
MKVPFDLSPQFQLMGMRSVALAYVQPTIHLRSKGGISEQATSNIVKLRMPSECLRTDALLYH